MSGLPTVEPLRGPRRVWPGIRTLSPLLAHIRTPVHRDGYALVLNSAITAVIGLAYWMIAARTYPAHVVGVNAALISDGWNGNSEPRILHTACWKTRSTPSNGRARKREYSTELVKIRCRS